jgi:hypothetical protein
MDVPPLGRQTWSRIQIVGTMSDRDKSRQRNGEFLPCTSFQFPIPDPLTHTPTHTFHHADQYATSSSCLGKRARGRRMVSAENMNSDDLVNLEGTEGPSPLCHMSYRHESAPDSAESSEDLKSSASSGSEGSNMPDNWGWFVEGD